MYLCRLKPKRAFYGTEISVGNTDFSNIIEGGYVYVDKTALVHQLANDGKYYFLSRPRRFGKSLLLSTLDAYFSGRKELFRGLAMERLETEWKSYPVLRLDLNTGDYTQDASSLTDTLTRYLRNWEREYDLEPSDTALGVWFGTVIEQIYRKTGKQVVILVDEYDKPLIANVERSKQDLQEQMRNMLKAFYGNVKTMDACIKFALFTGVSRFSHLSIFSDLNNLTDISLDDRYSELCGITEEELHHYFDAGISELAKANEMTRDEAYRTLKSMYDGFCFSRSGKQLYNLWSVLKALSQRTFGTYWYQSGTPSFLIKLIRDHQIDLTLLDGKIEALESTMMTYEDDANFIAPLYQTGYLTVKSYDRRTKSYTLGFPNLEVEQAFNLNLLPTYSRLAQPQADTLSIKIFRAAQAGDVDALLTTVKGILAEAPVESGDERVIELNYRNLIAISFRMSGLVSHIEVPTSGGRIDVVLEADDYVYLFEFKRTSLHAAVHQIEDRHYADRYLNDPRRLILVAVALDDTTRNIASWQVVEGR